MTAPTLATNRHLAAVQLAMTALAQALDDAGRQAAVRVLLTAKDALEKQCNARHQWLIRNDDKLTDYKTTLPADEYDAKEDVWLAKCAEYEEWFRVLADAYALIGQPAPQRPEAPVMAQGGLGL